MSQPATVRCRDCKEEWEPRYPLSEYRIRGGDRRLKCSECGQGRKGGVQIINEETSDAPTPKAVEEARFTRQKHQTKTHIINLFESIVGKSPYEYEKTDESSYRWSEGKETLDWWCDTEEQYELAIELRELYANLDTVTKPDELEAVNQRLDEFADELDVIEDSLQTLADVRREIEANEQLIEEHRQTIGDLETERDYLENQLSDLQERHDRAKEAYTELHAEAESRGFESIQAVLDELSDIDVIRERKEKRTEELRGLVYEKKHLEEQIDERHAIIDDLEFAISDRERDLDRLNQKIEQTESELAKIKKRLSKAEAIEDVEDLLNRTTIKKMPG